MANTNQDILGTLLGKAQGGLNPSVDLLTQLVGKSSGSAGRKAGEFTADNLVNLIRGLGGAAGAVSAIRPDIPGSAQAGIETAKKEFKDPFLEGARAALKDAGKAFAAEAVQQQGPKKTAEVFRQMSEGQLTSSQLTSSQSGQFAQTAGRFQESPQEMPTEFTDVNQDGDKSNSKMANLLVALGAGLVSAGGGDPSGILSIAGERAKLPAKLEEQRRELEGKKELELFKGDIDLRNKLAEAGSPDALTGDNAVKFTTVLEGLDASNELASFFNDKSSRFVIGNKLTPQFFKSQEGRLFDSALERAIQTKTRLETGAALAPGELESTKKRFAPSVGDSLSTMKRKLAPLQNFFNRTRSVIDPNDIHTQRATSDEALSSQISTLRAEAKRRGLI